MKRQILHDSTYMRSLEQTNPQRQKVGQRVPGPGEGGIGELLFNGHRVAVKDDENVLDMGCGDGCTML